MSRLRVQVLLWSAALLMTLVPLGLRLLPMGSTRGSMVFISAGACQVWQHEFEVDTQPVIWWLREYPILLVGPAFAVWLRTRWRWVAWVTALLLTASGLLKPAMMAYDVARWGEQCRRLWEPTAQFMWGPLVWSLLPAVLIAATVVRRPRWRWWMRVPVMIALLAPLLVVAGDRRPAPAAVVTQHECASTRQAVQGRDDTWPRAISRLTPRERERQFVCAVHGRGPWYKRSDGELLWLGRGECEARGTLFWPGALAYLCPEVAASRDPQLLVTPRQRDEEFARSQARELAYCTSKMPRSDRRMTKLVMPPEGGGYHVGVSDFDLGMAAIKDGLVAAGPNGVEVSTSEDDLCVTLRILKKNPRVEANGWDRVVEVGFDSTGKGPALGSSDYEPEFPVKLRPGAYRVRIHMRDLSQQGAELPRERHLVEVFPGSSKRTVVYR
ncbi:hypothetical protein [Actinomadura barringtoniae]|uniref:hypothetical protein n=1 Tax=Actinomadura barringtoniae TaxID=1427535 RepID=UPI001FB77ABC|nr:hypothetical protein [Actinomadura barringtoniae]